MHERIGIGMAFQASGMWNIHAAQNQLSPCHQRMHVVAYANMDHASNYRNRPPSGPSNLFFAGHARVEPDRE